MPKTYLVSSEFTSTHHLFHEMRWKMCEQAEEKVAASCTHPAAKVLPLSKELTDQIVLDIQRGWDLEMNNRLISFPREAEATLATEQILCEFLCPTPGSSSHENKWDNLQLMNPYLFQKIGSSQGLAVEQQVYLVNYLKIVRSNGNIISLDAIDTRSSSHRFIRKDNTSSSEVQFFYRGEMSFFFFPCSDGRGWVLYGKRKYAFRAHLFICSQDSEWVKEIIAQIQDQQAFLKEKKILFPSQLNISLANGEEYTFYPLVHTKHTTELRDPSLFNENHPYANVPPHYHLEITLFAPELMLSDKEAKRRFRTLVYLVTLQSLLITACTVFVSLLVRFLQWTMSYLPFKKQSAPALPAPLSQPGTPENITLSLSEPDLTLPGRQSPPPSSLLFPSKRLLFTQTTSYSDLSHKTDTVSPCIRSLQKRLSL